MARKNYSDEFRRQAVDLYETSPGATVRSIAEDLGIVRGTLRHWLEVHGTYWNKQDAISAAHLIMREGGSGTVTDLDLTWS